MSKLVYFGLAILALTVSACGFDGVEPKGDDESSIRLETAQTAFCVVLSHEVNLPLGKLEACSEVDEDGLHFVEFSPIKIGVYDANFVPEGDFQPLADDVVVSPDDHNVLTVTFAKDGSGDTVNPLRAGQITFCVHNVKGEFVDVKVNEILAGVNEEITANKCFDFKGLLIGVPLAFTFVSEGLKTFTTPTAKPAEGDEDKRIILLNDIPLSMNITLQPEEELVEGALSFSADDGGVPKYMVFLGGESLTLTLPPIFQVQDGVRVEVTGFECGHEMADHVTVDADCTTITPGGEAGCEIITVSYDDATIEIHATNVDRGESDSPSDWDRGPVCE